MTVTLSALRLYRIVRDLHAGDDLRPEDREALAQAFSAYLSGASPDLDSAMGLKPSAGERDWRTTGATAFRDELIRDATSRFFPGLSAAAQAEGLHTALKRYAAHAWIRNDRLSALCPEDYAGRIEEVLWLILKLRDHPLGAAHIRRILRTS